MEYYFRQLSNFAGKYNSGPNEGQQAVVPSEVIYNHGFGMEAGYFLIPKRFEVNFHHLADLWRLWPQPWLCRWGQLVCQRHAQLQVVL